MGWRWWLHVGPNITPAMVYDPPRIRLGHTVAFVLACFEEWLAEADEARSHR